MITRKNSVIATVVAAVFIAAGPSFAGQGRGTSGPKTGTRSQPVGRTRLWRRGLRARSSTVPQKVRKRRPRGRRRWRQRAEDTSTSPKSGTASAKATGKSTTTTSSTKTTGSAKKTEPAKTSTSTPGTSTTSTTTLTPVQQKLQQNTNLANKLETRLPKGDR